MNYDQALVARVLEDRSLDVALREGARRELLEGEAKLWWDTLVEHYDQYHEVPSVPMFEGLCPDYTHQVPQDGLKAIVDELKTIQLGGAITDGIREVAEVCAADPWEARKLLVEYADKINAGNQRGNTEYIVGADVDRVKNRLKRAREGGGLLGYQFPLEYLNKNTQGLMPGNVVYLYGRQKSKKTFLLLYWALFYAMTLNMRVLFFTREMSEEELKNRIYPMMLGIDIDKWKRGELTSNQETNLYLLMQELADSKNFIICDQSGEGVTGFKAKIEEYRPQIVIHDFFFAMAQDAMGDKVRDETRMVNRTIDQIVDYISTKAKIPCILCGHANRDGDKSKGFSSTEHAHSDHITRRVDMALRLIADDVSDMLGVVINAGRSIQQALSWTISGKLYDGFADHLSDHAEWVLSAGDKEEENKSRRRTNSVPEGEGEPSAFSMSDFKQPERFKRRK